ncbi:PAAR domain-containing protein [Burkholderia pseudomultivorans]|uniref:PAAR domain-containing protein n=1 Tax=Burkholderia pseudomultivorans TaxID=1207504 RepID=UPI0009BD7D50|nr:PAAR domain-containing protein [Burkholderia pseudomultivorans]MDS0858393.1 PAAR domain-containing protein [Burkholderia pseudomultivorans]
MARPFIVLGDTHSHGGRVTSASTIAKVDGKGIARRNDTVSCPIHGPNYIDEGDDSAIIESQAVARDGYRTKCGATLIASQSNTGGE